MYERYIQHFEVFSFVFYTAQTIVESFAFFFLIPEVDFLAAIPTHCPTFYERGKEKKEGEGALIFEQLHFRFKPPHSFFGWVAWRKMGHEFSNGEGRGRTAAENYLRQEN